jgi:hypothetical protein
VTNYGAPWQAHSQFEPMNIVGHVDASADGMGMECIHICDVNDDAPDAMAVARLIAATPKLLAACEAFAAYDDGRNFDIAELIAYGEAIKLTRAALASAKGAA